MLILIIITIPNLEDSNIYVQEGNMHLQDIVSNVIVPRCINSSME